MFDFHVFWIRFFVSRLRFFLFLRCWCFLDDDGWVIVYLVAWKKKKTVFRPPWTPGMLLISENLLVRAGQRAGSCRVVQGRAVPCVPCSDFQLRFRGKLFNVLKNNSNVSCIFVLFSCRAVPGRAMRAVQRFFRPLSSPAPGQQKTPMPKTPKNTLKPESRGTWRHITAPRGTPRPKNTKTAWSVAGSF